MSHHKPQQTAAGRTEAEPQVQTEPVVGYQATAKAVGEPAKPSHAAVLEPCANGSSWAMSMTDVFDEYATSEGRLSLSGRERSLVALANLLHGEEQDEPADAHDKLAPLEVGRPGGPQQVFELRLHRVVAGEADGRQLQYVRAVGVWPPAVAKDGLHLHQDSRASEPG